MSCINPKQMRCLLLGYSVMFYVLWEMHYLLRLMHDVGPFYIENMFFHYTNISFLAWSQIRSTKKPESYKMMQLGHSNDTIWSSTLEVYHVTRKTNNYFALTCYELPWGAVNYKTCDVNRRLISTSWGLIRDTLRIYKDNDNDHK